MQVKLRYPADGNKNTILNAFKNTDFEKEIYTVCNMPGTTDFQINYNKADFKFLYEVVEE